MHMDTPHNTQTGRYPIAALELATTFPPLKNDNDITRGLENSTSVGHANWNILYCFYSEIYCKLDQRPPSHHFTCPSIWCTWGSSPAGAGRRPCWSPAGRLHAWPGRPAPTPARIFEQRITSVVSACSQMATLAELFMHFLQPCSCISGRGSGRRSWVSARRSSSPWRTCRTGGRGTAARLARCASPRPGWPSCPCPDATNTNDAFLFVGKWRMHLERSINGMRMLLPAWCLWRHQSSPTTRRCTRSCSRRHRLSASLSPVVFNHREHEVRSVGVVKGPRFWTRKSKGRALILYNFELNNLRILLDCEETTRDMAHYHP